MKVTKIDKLSRAVQKSESDKNLYSIGGPGGEDAKDFGGIFKTTLLVCFFAITFLSLYFRYRRFFMHHKPKIIIFAISLSSLLTIPSKASCIIQELCDSKFTHMDKKENLFSFPQYLKVLRYRIICYIDHDKIILRSRSS